MVDWEKMIFPPDLFNKARGAVSLKNTFVQANKKYCHCEPVTDVTGVAIPPNRRENL